MRCEQELCPNWSGDGRVCPCAQHGFVRVGPTESPPLPPDAVLRAVPDAVVARTVEGEPVTIADLVSIVNRGLR